MEFNFSQNLEYCKQIVDAVSGLVYYSHIPAAILSLLIGVYVLFKSKFSLLGKILFSITIAFSLWIACDLLIWILYFKNSVVMTAWAPTEIFAIAMFTLCLYFVYVFIERKDASIVTKLIASTPLVVIIGLVPTMYNLTGYDIQECIAIENPYYTNGILILKILFSIFILGFALYKYFKVEKTFRKQIVLLTLGIIIFLLSFLVAGYIAAQTYVFMYEAIGLFGMVVFLAFLSYLIVKFKAFNIKLLATQALVVALAASIGASIFIDDPIYSIIINTVTFLLTVCIGYFLVQSVKREIVAREEVEELSQEKSEFMSFAAHEIRNPLTSMKGYASNMLDGDYGQLAPELRDSAQKILVRGNEVVNLISQYLDKSKIELGQLVYHFANFNFADLVRSVTQGFAPHAEQAGIKLHFTAGENEDYVINGDEGKLKEVVGNLIDNSIKYTHEGSVDVSISIHDGNVLLKIADTGVGIPAEVIPKLFKKFARADNKESNILGTGLGLFLAHTFVTAHSGKIWVESPGDGMGSTFFVELPKTQLAQPAK